jgi:hypothetical protein
MSATPARPWWIQAISSRTPDRHLLHRCHHGAKRKGNVVVKIPFLPGTKIEVRTHNINFDHEENYP